MIVALVALDYIRTLAVLFVLGAAAKNTHQQWQHLNTSSGSRLSPYSFILSELRGKIEQGRSLKAALDLRQPCWKRPAPASMTSDARKRDEAKCVADDVVTLTRL